uniref:hypothetical protein n=1 Tax=Halostella sp. PRR32 TaxID=3098147 RepID=UPI002B1DA51B
QPIRLLISGMCFYLVRNTMFTQFNPQLVCDPGSVSVELSSRGVLRGEGSVDRAIVSGERAGTLDRSTGGDSR